MPDTMTRPCDFRHRLLGSGGRARLRIDAHRFSLGDAPQVVETPGEGRSTDAEMRGRGAEPVVQVGGRVALLPPGEEQPRRHEHPGGEVLGQLFHAVAIAATRRIGGSPSNGK